MQLRANHLTISRMLLLPIPCVLLFGGFWELLVALAMFALLALTDWWDGKLARKQGPTVLGGLLDPIADKMFLAFTYVPFSRIEGVEGSGVSLFPVWLVSAMFFRELAVTGMRSLAAGHGIEFQTAILAKYKTAFQMGGGGVMCWLIIWQDNRWASIGGVAGFLAFVVGIAVYRLLRGRAVGLKVWTQIVGFFLAVVLVVLAPVQVVLICAYSIIIGITLLSGAQYAQRVVTGLREKGWPASVGELTLGFFESASPVVFVTLLLVPAVPVWAVIMLLSGELAGGGLCDLLATEGVRRRAWVAWLRCLVYVALGGLAWASGLGYTVPDLAPPAVMAAGGVSMIYCLGLFITHRKLYMR